MARRLTVGRKHQFVAQGGKKRRAGQVSGAYSIGRLRFYDPLLAKTRRGFSRQSSGNIVFRLAIFGRSMAVI